MRYLIILIMAMLASCHSLKDEGHAHDTEGNHIDQREEEIPAIAHTIWTDKTELFVEFPALVAGNSSRFAAHFTVLEKHQPVREGKVTVSLIKDDKVIRHTVEAPSSPGIFIPSIQPTSPGIYQLVFDIATPTYKDSIVIDKIQVFASAEEAIDAIGSEDEAASGISFLKEQAWKIDFQTSPAITGKIHEVIQTSGVWKAAPGGIKVLISNSTGVVRFAIDNLTVGTTVKKGQLLMAVNSKGLTSNNLQTEIEQARINLEQAKAEYDRKKQLYESKIVPKSEFEQVENRFQVAKLSYETLKTGYSASGQKIVAPFGGFVKSININNGDYVTQGSALISMGSQRSRLLETQVSPAYATELQSIHNIWYQPKNGKWSNLNESGGTILSVGKEVGNDKPMIPIYAQINEEVEMPEGSFTEVQIAMGEGEQSILIPENALLEDYGAYSVIVQLSGEGFERRPIRIGIRNGQHVSVKEGLREGEVVVSTGAYQVKMASMSGQTPAHGHEH